MSAEPDDRERHELQENGRQENGLPENGSGAFGPGADQQGFPSEAEWLDLPMPPLVDEPADVGDQGDGDHPDKTGDADKPGADKPGAAEPGDFVARVLRARAAERQLDAELARLDAELPHALLQQFAPPPVSDEFVAATVAAIQRDRQQRWRTLMARYVAPEPSPQFVDRTLQAVFGESAPAATGSKPGPQLSPIAPAGVAPARAAAAEPWPRARRWSWSLGSGSLGSGGLAAAAAAVVAFLLWTPRQHDAPFELRIAERTPAERAWADAVSPLPNMLASLAASEEPDALFDAPVNGLWLVAATEGAR